MLTKLAIKNYRSILDLVISLDKLNLVVGANGSGKSNLYKALRLLANTAQGGIIQSIAQEGGIQSSFWAGPELSKGMLKGGVDIQGTHRKENTHLELGLSTDDFSYSISLAVAFFMPQGAREITAFNLDPVIKKENIWLYDLYKSQRRLLTRSNRTVTARQNKQFIVIEQDLLPYTGIFNYPAIPRDIEQFFALRMLINDWRFYDHFRTDRDAPARQPQLGTYTPVLHHDGRDLAAALQTIIEMGDKHALDEAINDAFPETRLNIDYELGGLFSINLHQRGLLRPLTGGELSDGTLRFLLLCAALLSTVPPSLMILNEPETSLHPNLIPALARLIVKVSDQTQIIVVSHSAKMVEILADQSTANVIKLTKESGQTKIENQGFLDAPAWIWP